MRRTYWLILSCIGLAFLTGCSSGDGQKMFYWERANTGAVWFARDHNECLAAADWWPYRMPALPWGWNAPRELELRFDNNSDHGIWAQFRPFPGAQPVHVNSAVPDWSMSYDDYEYCMEQRNYIQRKPAREDRQVFYE